MEKLAKHKTLKKKQKDALSKRKIFWATIDEDCLNYTWMCIASYNPKKPNGQNAFKDYCISGRYYYIKENKNKRFDVFTLNKSKLEFSLKKSDLFKYFKTYKLDHPLHKEEQKYKKKFRKRKRIAAILYNAQKENLEELNKYLPDLKSRKK